MWIGNNYINGEFVESCGEPFNKTDPSSEQVLGSFFNSTEDEIDKAYEAARTASKSWRKISRVQRAEYMYEIAKLIEKKREYLAEIISWETGKTTTNPLPK